MSLPQRARGVKVLKAVSSPLRLNILNLFFDKGALSYTELMNSLKMNPSRDAGRFAYHLKFLLKTNLVEADAESRKYFLTDLGKMVIDVADRVEKKAHKQKGMLVRTSHSTMEEFDPNKIANSLIREAKMPPDLAQKTAKEAEKLLLKSKTKYITAPLIREVVNAILIEKGLEEYRHKLTRLGLPVHEVTALIDAKDNPQNSNAILTNAGTTVLSEYTLLNVLPRDIADAHASGAIHLNNIGTWLLKANEIMHDLRFFYQNGIKTTNPLQLSANPPQNFESALSVTFNVLMHTATEINELQTCDHFNVFLAPFTKNMEPQKIKENLHQFILNINQHVNAAFSIDLTIPKLVAEKPAIGPQGKTNDKYSDFAPESQRLSQLIVEIFTEETSPKPILNPALIIKITNEALKDEKATQTLTEAHKLATEKGTPYFVNMLQQEEKQVSFSGTGCKFEVEQDGDWETDTLRTGCLGSVTINLPRIIYESEKEKNKFFEILKERYELATRAIQIKQRTLRQHGKTTLPFINQTTNGDTYLRLENCSGIINLAGLKESIEAFNDKNTINKEHMDFTGEIVQNLTTFKQKTGKKHMKRLFPAILRSQESSERMAQLDIEKYGIAKTKFSGTRDKPFYSTTRRLRFQAGNFPTIPPESLEIDQKLQGLNSGGNLTIIELEEPHQPEELVSLTKQLTEKQTVEFFTYNRRTTYCSNCQKSWIGILHKCPSCGAISTLVIFDRFTTT